MASLEITQNQAKVILRALTICASLEQNEATYGSVLVDVGYNLKEIING